MEWHNTIKHTTLYTSIQDQKYKNIQDENNKKRNHHDIYTIIITIIAIIVAIIITTNYIIT